MKTPRIEGLVKELRMVANMINMGEKIRWGQETSLMDEAADALEALTKAHQAGIDEVVEKLKKIDWKNGSLGNTPYNEQIIDYYEKTLDDTIKALQDNK